MTRKATSSPAATTTAATATIKWTPVNGAIGYQLECGDQMIDEGFNEEDGVVSVTVDGLSTLKSYAVTINAILADPADSSSTILSDPATTIVKTQALRTLTTPTTNAVTDATCDSLTISWTKIDGAVGYTFAYRATDATSFKTVTITNPETTSYTLTGLTAETSYTVKVRATGDSVETRTSAYGATADFMTAELPASMPTITASSTTAATATLSWEPVPGATGYRVVCGTKAVNVGADATSGTVAGLKASTSYSASVAAIFNGSVGDATTTSVKTTAQLKLVAPKFTMTPGAGSITVSWDKIEGAEGYTIAYSLGNKSSFKTIKLGSGDTTSYTITGLNLGTEYKIKMRTEGDGEESRTSSYGSIVKSTTLSNAILDEAFAELFEDDFELEF